MSVNSSKNWSRSSTSSRKSLRSGKSLVEKIRELGFNYRNERPPTTWDSLQYIDIKYESNRPSDYSIMIPDLNLEQITYFQPELTIDETAPGKPIYKIGKLDAKPKGPKEVMRISDIEVKSYKPNRKMKFRRKKRHSSIINRIEDILYKGKAPILSRDPSEESVYLENKPDEEEKNINDLPENILLKIFSLFTLKERNLLLSRVSKSWYYVLKDPIFWTELEFHGNKVAKDTIIDLVRRYPLMKKLSMTSVPEVDKILLELCRPQGIITANNLQLLKNTIAELGMNLGCNHNITHIAVRYCILESQDFARIILHVVSCCTNLVVLDIKGMSFQSERFFLEIGRLKNLISINLTGNKMLRSQDLITLSVNCRTLQELRILDIAPEGGQGCLRDEDLTFIAFHLKQNLRTLKIDMKQLRNVSYQAILNCSGLICLALINCLHLSSETFREFPALKNLKKLKLTRAINLKSEDFQCVFENENMSKIEDLNINGCWGIGEVGFKAITQSLSSLKSLSLKNCKSIKGDHLKHLPLCRDLIHLNIAHTEVEYNHLVPLCQQMKALGSLVIDTDMCKKSTIQHLQKFFPSIRIILSFSEYQKDERPLDDK